ncbi:hypothetical protein [Rhizobium sp. Leaf262]|uniref:hypothetical protein n=1 Tax=Rhizobium sp. Leaf262 TaxID=1736312 RepID=UPI000714204C|nr:hypothetical protein [Rhizobium sp. Leaf262]KQO75921.1 hypothetical protein ASF29_12110 [Rhizobium sp. Leaf262]
MTTIVRDDTGDDVLRFQKPFIFDLKSASVRVCAHDLHLFSIMTFAGPLSSNEVADAAEHWHRSYLHTPHGQAAELSRAWPPHNLDVHDDHHHHYHNHGITRQVEPLRINPPRLQNT